MQMREERDVEIYETWIARDEQNDGLDVGDGGPREEVGRQGVNTSS